MPRAVSPSPASSRGLACAATVAVLVAACATIVEGQAAFRRGDCNSSREATGPAVDLSDAIAAYSYLFEDTDPFAPPCLDACDANDDGFVDFADPITILQYAFRFGRHPPAPGPDLAGPDPTDDFLGCEGGAGVPPPESCGNGGDDDGDGLADLADPDCQVAFACGGWRLGEDGLPLPLQGSVGTPVDVTIYLKSPVDPVQGMSVALTYCGDLRAWPAFDVSVAFYEGGVLEEAMFDVEPPYIRIDFGSIDVDNEDSDGDGRELVCGMVLEAFPAFHGDVIPPTTGFKKFAIFYFDITDDSSGCGTCCPIEFVDGIDGRGNVPAHNLVTIRNRSIRPQLLGCEVCIVGQEKFYRGDCDFSRRAGGLAVDIADAAAVVRHLFGSGDGAFDPPCLDACDCNDDSWLDISDAVCILEYAFQFGRYPRQPGPGRDPGGSVRPPGQDPTPDVLDCKGGNECGAPISPVLEDCDNGSDDDGDDLTDAADPDCRQTFACGSRELDALGNPGLITGRAGGLTEACLYIKNPDVGTDAPEGDRIRGFAMAVELPCILESGEALDIAGTALEEAGVEFISVQADNDPDDGDGCEVIIGVLLDVLPPFQAQTLPPGDGFERVGCIALRIADDQDLCGECLPVSFADGIDGRGNIPVENLVSTAGGVKRPLFRHGEVCVGDLDTNGDGRPDLCSDPLDAARFFIRADSNGSGRVDLSDVLHLLDFLFAAGPATICPRAADGDADGYLKIADAIYVLGHLFLGGAPPPAPFPACGRVSTPSGLECEAYAACNGG